MMGILTADFGSLVTDLIDEEAAAGHLRMLSGVAGMLALAHTKTPHD